MLKWWWCSLLLAFLASVAAEAASKADLSAKTLEGQTVRLKDLRGKFVVLNFWATWCTPCREEMPMLVRVAAANLNRDLLFVAVAVDDQKTRSGVAGAAKEYGIPFPVWTGPNGDDLYRISKSEAVPATVFLDRDGTVQAAVSGQIREEELRLRIEWLTGNRSGEKPAAFVSHVRQ